MILVPLHTLADDEDLSRERKVRGRHVSKRDFIIVVIVLAAVSIVAKPACDDNVHKAEDAACRQNVKAIGQAVALYCEQSDGRLPPTHNIASGGRAGVADGYAVTWATKIKPQLSTRQSFLCRSANPEETVESLAGVANEKSFLLSYGMYRGLSTVPLNQIPDPDATIFAAETSNNGAEGSFDPKPFGSGKPDGFLIGWDDANLEFSKLSKWASRLAFRGASIGYGSAGVTGRHNDHINAVTVNGAYRALHPADAKIEHSDARLKGLWWADPNLYK